VQVYLHSFLTTALDGDERLASRPGRLTPEYALDMRLSGPQSQSGRCGEEKITFLPLLKMELRSSSP